ncbi:MAG: DUF4156 domain-containing protein [Polyangiaceae bacterium]
MRSLLLASTFAFATLSTIACSTPDLTPGGEKVIASPNPPAANCTRLDRVVGRGGGSFGGEFVANEDLIEYATNDARNLAAELGGNYLQTDPPQLGQADGTTTTATVSGTAYKCP